MANYTCTLKGISARVDSVRVAFSCQELYPNMTWEIKVPYTAPATPPTKAQCRAACEAKLQAYHDAQQASTAFVNDVMKNSTTFTVDVTL